MELEKYINPLYTGPKVIRGYLKKLKSTMALAKFISKFTKRYFVLDLSNYVFYYLKSENSVILQSYSLKNLVKIDSNPKIEDVCDWKFAFSIEIGKRKMTLHADSVSTYKMWVLGFEACIKPAAATINRLLPAENNLEEKPNGNTPEPEEMHYINKSAQREYTEYNSPSLGPSNPPVINLDLPEKNSYFNIAPSMPDFNKPKSPEKTETQPSGPVLNMIRSNEPVSNNKKVMQVKKKNLEDETEVLVINEPRRVSKKNEFDSIPVPVVQYRGKSQLVERGTKEKSDVFDVSQENFKKEEINFVQTGIADLMNEINDLGFDKIEVRAPKKLGNTDRFLQKNGTKTISEWGTENKATANKTLSNNKGNIGKIAVKNIKKMTSVKDRFVEKPDTVPDDPRYTKADPSKTSVVKKIIQSKSAMKEKPVYKETLKEANPQGLVNNWDDWDD